MKVLMQPSLRAFLLVTTAKRGFASSGASLAKKKVSKKAKGDGAAGTVTEKYFGRPSSRLSAGIVGLANVGKSTFFQAITNSSAGNAANYPFATIDPEELLITIPSERLNHLQKLYQSQKQIKGTLSICDIAGLTRGASKGKGLGNQFLNDIRSVDGIFQVVRGFQDSDITHMENSVDPVRDLTIVKEELLLKDLDFVETAIEQVSKKLKHNKSALEHTLLEAEVKALNKAQDVLLEGQRIASVKDWSNEDIDGLNKHNFLTAKPVTYLLNVNEEDYLRQDNEFLQLVQNWIKENSPNDNLLIFSAAVEAKLHENQAKELDGLKTAIPKIIQEMKNNLNLISFFTCGDVEAREWPLRKNSTAPEAAGIIHSDLQKTFVSSEIIKYADIANETPESFSLSKLRTSGKIHREGKQYIVEDGDIVLIKATAGKAR